MLSACEWKRRVARAKALATEQRNILARHRAIPPARKSARVHERPKASPRDERYVADRDAWVAILLPIDDYDDDVELMLVQRFAAASQRFEKCDHLQSPAFDLAFRGDQRSDGPILMDDERCCGVVAILTRRRAGASLEMRVPMTELEQRQAERHDRSEDDGNPSPGNDLPPMISDEPCGSNAAARPNDNGATPGGGAVRLEGEALELRPSPPPCSGPGAGAGRNGGCRRA